MARAKTLADFVLPEAGAIHKPKAVRFHVAQEYRDKGDHERAEEMVRPLTPWAAECALGLDSDARKRMGVHHA